MDDNKKPRMTESEHQAYQHWRAVKERLDAANLAFAAAVGGGVSEGHLIGIAHEVAQLQNEERSAYSSLRRKLSWRVLVAATTTWPTPLASELCDGKR